MDRGDRVDADFEARLQVGDLTVGPRDVALLLAIDDQRSLNAAAEALGRSYSRAHGRVTDLESELGPLVERQRGGAEGGGSELTPAARTLLAKYTRLQAALAGTATVEEAVVEGTVIERDGELVTVETPIGPLRAIQAVDADAVQVALPADAVTLHPPDEAPPEGGTSARNRFEGTVAAVDEREAVAYVSVALEPDVTLPVLLTRESLQRLGIEPSEPVVATFKATATRATPV
jgi:molybdate transport system regulatory protein